MSLDPTRPGDNWYATIIIVDSDGVPAAPDSTPTAILRKNGVEQTTTVTVTQCTDASSTARDGEYRLSATVPSGWSPGDVVDARVEVTLDSVTYSIYTAPTRLVSAGPEALPSYAAGRSGGLPVLQQVDSSHLFVDAYLRQGWTLQITSPTFSIGDTTLYNPDTLQPGSVFRIWSTAGGFAAGEDVYVVDNANTVVRGYNHTTEQDWAIGDNLSFVGFSAPNMVEILNGQGLTTTRAAKLDNADVAVSTIKAKTDNLPASPAAVGSAMTLADGAITAGKIAASALNGKGNWLTTLGTNAPANWLNAAAIAASALDGKGNWLLADDYTEPTTPPTAAQVATQVWSADERTLTDFGTLATSIATLVTKLTGITSLANWLRALVRKDTPDTTAASEINATGGGYDATTDSMQAIRDRGDAAWITGSGSSSGGDGSIAVTIPVQDADGNALQGARVSVARNGIRYDAALSDASGNAAGLNLVDGGVYTVAATLAGYSYAGGTLTVDAQGGGSWTAPAVAMTAVVITPPDDAGQINLMTYARTDNGAADAGGKVYYQLVTGGADTPASYAYGPEQTATADANGQVLIAWLPGNRIRWWRNRAKAKEYTVPLDAENGHELPEN